MAQINLREPSEEMMKLATPSENKGRMSIGMEESVGEYFFINLEKLIPFKNQARRHFDKEELDNLALSIMEYGIRQPLTVVKSPDHEDKFEIVSGERRAKAASSAGLTTVPCIIIQDYSKAESIALIENIHRSDLHPVELARAYNSLMNNGNFSSGEEVANSLGINKSSFYETLKILKLPETIQQALIDNGIKSREKLRSLLKSPNPEAAFERMIHPANKSGYCRTVIKIGMENGEFSVQRGIIDGLSQVDKNALKEILSGVIESLG